MARFVLFRKGGGGSVAINPEQVTHVRSATGAFTDVFVAGQQIAVEGTFDETVARLALAERRAAPPVPPLEPVDGQNALVLGGAGPRRGDRR